MNRKLILQWAAGMFLLLFLAQGNVFRAKAEEQEIVSWADGHGLDADGEMIAGTWAYDTVNAAGKYVLFDENGTVLRKQESLDENDLAESYTSTETTPGKFSIRCTVPDGFQGSVFITLQEVGGMLYTCELTESSLYRANLAVSSGSYTAAGSYGQWGDCLYEVIFPEETWTVEPEEVVILTLALGDVMEGNSSGFTESGFEEEWMDAETEKTETELSSSPILNEVSEYALETADNGNSGSSEDSNSSGNSGSGQKEWRVLFFPIAVLVLWMGALVARKKRHGR
ncbi:MAG: hypothetical protein LUF27_01250 [Lachnospiraceae bacterium]|nr:hypothetical protein [Lachnospiraceae bacterium]